MAMEDEKEEGNERVSCERRSIEALKSHSEAEGNKS
ncbi:uncharacterized protein G2W53_021073 [Senna tora]|uniref:Uncharacterized protein n=1 Tax=Senna tora TaxID=362788 RepID=A0A834TS81_9FABA|nr:uncharacterized protein G2W53_021073 [Senna tora]